MAPVVAAVAVLLLGGGAGYVIKQGNTQTKTVTSTVTSTVTVPAPVPPAGTTAGSCAIDLPTATLEMAV